MHYWASPIEARLCAGQEVALVVPATRPAGGGLSRQPNVKRCGCLARRKSLEATMSRYLVRTYQRAAQHRGAEQTEITALEGREHTLQRVRWRNRAAAKMHALRSAICSCSSVPTRTPTGWRNARSRWMSRASSAPEATGHGMPRKPTVAGVFAIGDVRQARSSALRRPSAKGRRWSRRCMPISRSSIEASRRLRSGTLMAEECEHAELVRDVTPSALGCEECLKTGSKWVHLRLCRICGHVGCCDDFAQPPRDEAFSRDRAPGDRGLRSAGGLGLVLHRRSSSSISATAPRRERDRDRDH